jgi:hypothetical protein
VNARLNQVGSTALVATGWCDGEIGTAHPSHDDSGPVTGGTVRTSTPPRSTKYRRDLDPLTDRLRFVGGGVLP